MVEVIVDTNYLITLLVTPRSKLEESKQESVQKLFAQIEANDITGLLPEVVLHETFYTLLGDRFQDIHIETLCSVIAEILTWRGWRFAPGDLEVYSTALENLQLNPKLEFSDSVIAARAEVYDAKLATFDRRLAKAYGGPMWADG